MMNAKKDQGFTATEFIVAIAIGSIVLFLVSSFARDLIILNSSAQSDMTAVLESRKVLSTMVSELRSIMPSAIGSYPIEAASTSSILFFADVNGDDVADRIRYFFDPVDRSVKRGLVLAAGSPPSYNLTNETISILVSGVLNEASLPLFQYYDGNYTGSSSPLPMPVNLQEIRLVKVNVRVNRDLNRPDPIVFSSQAALRNLKDNL